MTALKLPPPGSGGGTPEQRAATRHLIALVGIVHAATSGGPNLGMAAYIRSLGNAEKDLALAIAAGMLYSAAHDRAEDAGHTIDQWLAVMGMAAAEPT